MARMTDAPRWLPAHLPNAGPLHRPALTRDWSAPAVMERVEQAARDHYESFPRLRRPPLMQRLSEAARNVADDAADRAEAGLLRAAIRAALWWVRCCWRRR